MSHTAIRWRSVVLVLLLGMIAFANALGSIIVFPLAPFIAASLAIPSHQVALTSLAFSGAAGVGALCGALVLGALGRRTSLLLALGAVALTTAPIAFVPHPSVAVVLAARLASGFVSGPLLALVIATASDLSSEAGRGRAVSAIVGSYGFALLLGAPVSLSIEATTGSWQAAFGALTVLYVVLALPVAAGVFGRNTGPRPTSIGVRRLGAAIWPAGRGSGLLITAGASFATFLISPHVSAYALTNLSFSTDELATVYLVGGLLSFLTTGGAGWAIDRIGAVATSFVVGIVLSLILVYAFLLKQPLPAMALVLGMLLAAQMARSTVAQASASRIADPQDRIAYQCLVSATTNFASAAGAASSALVLRERLGGEVVGMPLLAAISITICWVSVALVARLERVRAARPAPGLAAE